MPAMRIVSLLPCATEMVFAIGLGDQLVGRSHECDYPESAKKLPILTSSKVDFHQRGSLIDKDVRTRIREGLSLYDVDFEGLKKLEPDVILTQDQCKVCAVSLNDVEAGLREMTQKSTRIVSLSPHRLEEIFGDILHVGGMLGSPSPATTLIGSLRARLSALSDFRTTPTPRVLCMEWLEPPMIGGGWIPELVRLAGGEPLIVSDPTRFREVDWETVLKADPDVFCLFPCGYPVTKTLEELPSSSGAAYLKQMRAVKNGKAFVLDGNAFFNRPGPRIVDSAEILAAVIQPDAHHFLSRYTKAISPICL